MKASVLNQSISLMERIAAENDSCMVALSGGKDSLVVLDIACQCFKTVQAFFMWIVPGLKCVEEPVDIAAKRHGIIVHKIPHWSLAERFKKGVFSSRNRGEKLRQQSIRDVEAYLAQKTEIAWHAYGHRQSDSVSRLFYLRKLEGIDRKHCRLHPIWNWKNQDVAWYLKARKIQPPADRFGQEGRRMQGFDLNPKSLNWLRENHPEDYERVRFFFPEVDIIHERESFAANSSGLAASAI